MGWHGGGGLGGGGRKVNYTQLNEEEEVEGEGLEMVVRKVLGGRASLRRSAGVENGQN